jgi:hypothetical protein
LIFEITILKNNFSYNRKLDPSDKGIIRRDILVEALTCYGDQMSQDELTKIIRENNQDNQSEEFFDYRQIFRKEKNPFSINDLPKEYRYWNTEPIMLIEIK